VRRVGRAKYDVSSLDGTSPPTDTRALCAHVCRVQVFAFAPGTNFLLAIPCPHVPLPTARFWLTALSFPPQIILADGTLAHTHLSVCTRHPRSLPSMERRLRSRGSRSTASTARKRCGPHAQLTRCSRRDLALLRHTSSHCASTARICNATAEWPHTRVSI
jgi:hypothetical protein